MSDVDNKFDMFELNKCYKYIYRQVSCADVNVGFHFFRDPYQDQKLMIIFTKFELAIKRVMLMVNLTYPSQIVVQMCTDKFPVRTPISKFTFFRDPCHDRKLMITDIKFELVIGRVMLIINLTYPSQIDAICAHRQYFLCGPVMLNFLFSEIPIMIEN